MCRCRHTLHSSSAIQQHKSPYLHAFNFSQSQVLSFFFFFFFFSIPFLNFPFSFTIIPITLCCCCVVGRFLLFWYEFFQSLTPLIPSGTVLELENSLSALRLVCFHLGFHCFSCHRLLVCCFCDVIFKVCCFSLFHGCPLSFWARSATSPLLFLFLFSIFLTITVSLFWV